ncbi:MAG: ribosome-associated translation inhibitor RaiA [Firmicutes bacterium]|nr:ribosome-associated translation inhibitor RaiA [Bacillota bacterium]
MKLLVRGRNIEVTDALKNYAEKKLSRIDKYFTFDAEAQVTMTVERGIHKVEVTAGINGMILRAEEATEDMYASIDQVVDKLERQLRKYKTRINRKARQNGGLKIKNDNFEENNEEEDTLEVVKNKRFLIKPMDVEEAILQMNLLGHDFYVFVNSELAEVNVVYRRKDGKYGLIEPTLE